MSHALPASVWTMPTIVDQLVTLTLVSENGCLSRFEGVLSALRRDVLDSDRLYQLFAILCDSDSLYQ